MIGIVIVSHSEALALAVVELGRAMGGTGAVLEAAGGTAEAGVLGTDAVRVAEAIERAFSEDGVLVLMDMGSAVLSAEMALDFLPEERRDRVLLCEAPLVEGLVSAASAARIGRSLEEVAAEARGALAAKAAHLAPPEPPAPSPGPASVDDPPAGEGEAVELLIVVPNPLGLHARPAARLVQAVGRFDAVVEITNLTAGRGPASGRSLNGVATLGLRQGDEMLVRARGAHAAEALAAVDALAKAQFGDADGPATTAARSGDVPVDGLAGVAASPGVVVGPVRDLGRGARPAPAELAGGSRRHWEDLERARQASRAEIAELRQSIARRAGEPAAAIFDAHLLILDDETLLEGVRRRMEDAGVDVDRAWAQEIDGVADAYRQLDDPYQQSRAVDVVEVGDRVLRHLTGASAGQPVLSGPGIVVASDLTPADTAGLDPDLALGVATSGGGPLSHAAILARSLGIPAVVGLGPEVLAIPEGTPVVLDGAAGYLRLAGAEDAQRAVDSVARGRAAGLHDSADSADDAPAVTRDGVVVPLLANVGSLAEVEEALRFGADGVGLFRTEFLFLGHPDIPGEDEQTAAYQRAADALGPRPLVIRTLDAGSDKPLPAAAARGLAVEANPALGLRGIRLTLARPELFTTQLRALLKVKGSHGRMVMFPMVTTVDELRRAKALLAEARESLLSEGAEPDHEISVGIMVEVPAAALTAPQFADEVDFFSIGTNDLTQYVTGADRGNAAVANLGDGLNPGVLRLVQVVAAAGAGHGRPVAVCGELAADTDAVALLLGLGVTELSVRPRAVPAVKQAVRNVDTDTARRVATEALDSDSAAGVRRLLRSEG